MRSAHHVPPVSYTHLAMAQRDENYALSGIVEMDDGYVGGATHNGKRGRGTDKACLLYTSGKGSAQRIKI